MKKIVILSNNYTTDKIAGIGIRFVEIANALSGEFEVTLALSNSKGFRSDKFAISEFRSDSEVLSLFKKNDVVITRGFNVIDSPKLSGYDIPMIFDLLCPFFFEGFETDKDDPAEFNRSVKDNRSLIDKLAKRGDFFICANQEQRDLWLAFLYQAGRIDHGTYTEDPSLNNLIDIVPFGFPSKPPVHSKNTIKGVIPGIRQSDKVILWFGGLWDWLDPLSVISAMKEISAKRNDIKLLFVGGKHPDPSTRAHDMLAKAEGAAKGLGLYDKTVFFIDWVPYENRADYLLEGDIGIITHNYNLETRFSWRTRVLDHLWGGLPTIMTKGDPMSSIIEKENMGLLVNYNDTRDIERAINKLIDDEHLRKSMRSNIEKYKEELTWDRVIRPISKFCCDPKRTSNRKLAGR